MPFTGIDIVFSAAYHKVYRLDNEPTLIIIFFKINHLTNDFIFNNQYKISYYKTKFQYNYTEIEFICQQNS